MSKYIVEHKKTNPGIFAWISVLLIILNVFHTHVITVLMGANHFSLNISILTLSVFFLMVYMYFANKLNISVISFHFHDYMMLAALLIILATSASRLAANSSYIIRYLWLIILVFFMKNDDKLVKIVFISLTIAMILHLVATYWFHFDKDFYLKHILPTFAAYQRNHLYVQAIKNNYSVGLANNFSLNGMYMAIVSIISYSLLYYKKKKVLTFTFFLASIVALFMTGKRGVLIFTIVAFIITYMMCNKDNVLYKLGIVIPVLLAIVVALYIMSFYIDSINATISRFFTSVPDISTGRFNLYNKAWEMFLQNPILGIGWSEYASRVDYMYFGDNEYRDVHNVYLQLLTETGIIGFLVFMILFVYAFVKTFTLVKIFLKRNDVLPNGTWVLLVFSFCYQIFFFGYCMTGNPLYDLSTMYVYFFSVGFASYIDTKYSDKINNTENTQFVSKYIRR